MDPEFNSFEGSELNPISISISLSISTCIITSFVPQNLTLNRVPKRISNPE